MNRPETRSEPVTPSCGGRANQAGPSPLIGEVIMPGVHARSLESIVVVDPGALYLPAR